ASSACSSPRTCRYRSRSKSAAITIPRLIFSFNCSPAPPYLPSFPTRRSSDLISRSCCSYSASAIRRWWSGVGWLSLHHRLIADRSEEHTSELQSRSDLVCRLLLEKKKVLEVALGIHAIRRPLLPPAAQLSARS